MLGCEQAYADLYEFLQSTDANGRLSLQQVVVSGNPGVGKSMLLVYYLLRFVRHSACLLVKGPQACFLMLQMSICVMVCLSLVYSLLG